MGSTRMNSKTLICTAIVVALMVIVWIDSQSRPHSVEESLVVGTTQNAIAGDSPHQSIAKTAKGLVQKAMVEAVGAVIEDSGTEVTMAAREYAEQTDPITGSIFVGSIKLFRFLVFAVLVLLPLGGIWTIAKKLRL